MHGSSTRYHWKASCDLRLEIGRWMNSEFAWAVCCWWSQLLTDTTLQLDALLWTFTCYFESWSSIPNAKIFVRWRFFAMHNAETLGLRMVLVMAVVDYGDCYYTFVMGRPCGWLSLRLFYSWMTLAILVCSNWNTTCAWAKSFLRSSNILFLDNSCYFWRPIFSARPYWQFRNSLCVHDCPNHD